MDHKSFYNGICASADSWQTEAQCERALSTVSLGDVHTRVPSAMFAWTGAAHPGTCSHPELFVRRHMHMLTQSLYMCKLLIAHIQT